MEYAVRHHIATPIPGFTAGQYQISGYNLFVVAMAVVVSQTFTLLSTPAVGEIALLVVAVVLLRLLPTGITGRFLRNRV
jgi:hypothetical protein